MIVPHAPDAAPPQGYFDRFPGLPGRTNQPRPGQDNQVSLDEIGESGDGDLEQEYGGAQDDAETEEEISWR